MNCLEYRDFLQRLLDGEASLNEANFAPHEASCAECRGLKHAAQLLQEGLRSRTRPFPDSAFTNHIVHRVRQDRFRQQRQRVFALAAGVMLAVGLGYVMVQSRIFDAPRTDVIAIAPVHTPSLELSVREAREAVAALTRRTADETVGPSALLLPDLSQMPLAADTGVWEDVIEEPARSLRDAGQGVSVALEPVTTSARRAVALLMREIPTVQREKIPGS